MLLLVCQIDQFSNNTVCAIYGCTKEIVLYNAGCLSVRLIIHPQMYCDGLIMFMNIL